jgi:thiol-disulfide isomerase/thioredoxin
MKKPLLILATVAALILGTYFADKATRVPRKNMSVKSTGLPDNPAVGTPAPEVTLKDINDKDITLAQLKGKVVLVNFWATWCEPCRVEIPWLIDMQQKYSAKGFTVLGVAMDEEGKSVVAPWVAKERFDVNGQKLPMSYPIVIGSDAAAEKFGGLFGYPTSILISRDGKQIKRITGLISYEEISKAIESQL